MSLHPPPLNQNDTSLQPFNLLPDELLLSIFQLFDPIKRSLLLPTCRKWHHFLLLHHSLWNVLILSPQWSFEESLSILKLFNSRSGHQLKHVVLGVKARNLDELERMFQELKRSGKSLKVLGLCHEERLGKRMQVLARDLLPSLNTIAGGYHEADDFSSWNSALWFNREELKVGDEDEGIKFCQLDEFGRFEPQDRNWLSTAKYIRLAKIRSMKGLYSILKAARSSLVDLDLLAIHTKNSLEMDESVTSKISGTLEMADLVELGIPSIPEYSLALRRWITIRDASRLFLKGEIDSLIAFNMEGVKKVEVILYMDTEFDTLAKISVLIDLFLKQNESVEVEELILDCEDQALKASCRGDSWFIESICLAGTSSFRKPKEVCLLWSDMSIFDTD